MTTLIASVRTKGNLIARYPLLSFFSLAIVIGWLAILPSQIWGAPFKPFQTIGAYGPLLAAVIVSAAEGGEALRSLWRRMTNFRFGIGWYLFAILFFAALYMVMAALSGAPVVASLSGRWSLLFTVYLPAMFTTHLINAVGEQFGWTGFAQHHMQSRFHPLLAATLLGVLWAVWHLPAYFVPSEMGAFNPAAFVIFTIQLILLRIIFSWAANRAQGSAIFAALLHASSNAVSLALIPQLLPTPTPDQMALSGMILLGLLLVIAAGLAIATRGRLGYQDSQVMRSVQN